MERSRGPTWRRRLGWLLSLIAAAGAAVVLWPGPAFAGGTHVTLVAGAGRVWVTTGFDVVKLDAFTGQIMRRNRTRYPSPTEIGMSDGNIWVTSVENGFVSGALTRIPFEAGPVTQPLVYPSQPLLGLAVGSGTTWALVGPWAALKLAAVDQANGRSSVVRLRTKIGWIAADNTGDTAGLFGITTSGRAVRLGTGGRIAWRAATDTIESPPIVGLGKLWVASGTALYRINPASGRVEAKIAVASTSAELTVGGGYVWMIRLRDTNDGGRYTLLKIDPRTARIVRQAKLASPAGGISFGENALWLGRATPTVGVIRIDPRTLKQRLFAKNLG